MGLLTQGVTKKCTFYISNKRLRLRFGVLTKRSIMSSMWAAHDHISRADLGSQSNPYTVYIILCM